MQDLRVSENKTCSAEKSIEKINDKLKQFNDDMRKILDSGKVNFTKIDVPDSLIIK